MVSDALRLPFVRFGPALPSGPVVVTVPHGGRAYPPALLDAARLDRETLQSLEDRYADLLTRDAVHAGAIVLVATPARAWIDLNRDPREVDPAMVVPPPDDVVASLKVRAGLGLIPRRVAGHGDVYSRPLTIEEVSGRIATVHRPWHDAVADALAAARDRFGVAILVDLHSMPTLGGAEPPRLVVGDRHRRSAAARIVSAAMRLGKAAGLRPALNDPYPGDYALARHGRPACNVHAIQIELCRSLYLDGERRAPGDGLDATRRFVADLVTALGAEALPAAIAAE